MLKKYTGHRGAISVPKDVKVALDRIDFGPNPLSIDQIVEIAEEHGAFEKLDRDEVFLAYKKSICRKQRRSVTDETGWKVIHSVKVKSKDGLLFEAYMDERIFGDIQYAQVRQAACNRASRFITLANELTRRERKALGKSAKQLPLPYPEELEVKHAPSQTIVASK